MEDFITSLKSKAQVSDGAAAAPAPKAKK